MIELGNRELAVSVLHPNEDRGLLGSRYSAGGYVFQIEDVRLGPLLTGPTYPDTFEWYHGQGIPDSFAATPLFPSQVDDPLVLVLGVGTCSRNLSSVVRFDEWVIAHCDRDSLTASVIHRIDELTIVLTRSLTLVGRTLISTTTVSNRSAQQFVFTWFPHPFFPVPESPELVRFSTQVRLPEKSAFGVRDDGFIVRTSPATEPGEYAALEHRTGPGMTILQRHPTLGLIAADIDYAPSLLPIWGNSRTFSWEPHLDRSLAAGESTSWTVSYYF